MQKRLEMLPWLWLGAALLFVAVVAPAAFAVLPTRTLAGLLVGRVLPVLFWSGAGIGALLVAAHRGWRRSAALVLVLSSLGAQLGVAPRIHRLRAELGPNIERVAASDARRLAFGRWHAVSVVLLGVAMVGAASVALGSVRFTADFTPAALPSPPVVPKLPSGV